MDDLSVTMKVIVNLILVALGYLIKRSGLLSRDDGRVLNRLVLYVTLPAMNLKVISRTELSWQLFLLPAVFLLSAVLISQLGKLPARWLRLPQAATGTFLISLCGVMGSMAYPFAEAGFGEEGVRAVALGDLGNAIAIFAIAYIMSFHYAPNGEFDPWQVAKRVLTFFPLLAFILAVVLNLAGIELRGLPGGVVEALASINSPLMLLGLGVYLDLDITWHESKILLTQALHKYGLGLLVALFVIAVLPFRGGTRAAAFLLPLMPSSLSSLLYSVEQQLDPRLAAMMISLTMIISLIFTTVILLGFRGWF